MTEDWRAKHRRHMRGSLRGGLLAAAGAGLAFMIDVGPHNPWAWLAASLTITGIGIGNHHLAQARSITIAEFRKMDRESAERRAKRRDGRPET